MNFVSRHGPNVGSDDPLGPTPLQYNLRLLLGLPIVNVLVWFFISGKLSLVLSLAAIALWVNYLHKMCWTSSLLFPESYQSDFVAANGRWDRLMDLRADTSKYLIIKDPQFNRYKTRKIPLFFFVEAYRQGKVAIIGDDLPTAFANINDWAYSAMTMEYVKFIFFEYLLDVAVHSKSQDSDQVQGHYNTGNDFFGWYLGPRMVYTSGYYFKGDESLERAQDQKMEVVARKIKLGEGMKVLDLGSGWGTWVMYSAKKWGTKSTGLTVAKEQVEFASERAKKNGIKNVDWLLRDYRDMPRGPGKRYDRVTCFEMSEHVGVKRYPEFLQMVWDALEDDGIFYLQIAGLRERWQYEDVVWGIWMYRYIFRGADASLPLNWVVGQLERAGFGVQSVENLDFHYTTTIRQWRDNWVKNKKEVEKVYSSEMHRIWDIFLSWSPLIGDRGSSTCWQIVAYKNLDTYKRRKFCAVAPNLHKGETSFDELQ